MKKIVFLIMIFITSFLEMNKIFAEDKGLVVNANACILYDSTYDKVLFNKNSNVRLANASTTKILTAIVGYENSNMDEIVEISAKAAQIGRFGCGF